MVPGASVEAEAFPWHGPCIQQALSERTLSPTLELGTLCVSPSCPLWIGSGKPVQLIALQGTMGCAQAPVFLPGAFSAFWLILQKKDPDPRAPGSPHPRAPVLDSGVPGAVAGPWSSQAALIRALWLGRRRQDQSVCCSPGGSLCPGWWGPALPLTLARRRCSCLSAERHQAQAPEMTQSHFDLVTADSSHLCTVSLSGPESLSISGPRGWRPAFTSEPGALPTLTGSPPPRSHSSSFAGLRFWPQNAACGPWAAPRSQRAGRLVFPEAQPLSVAWPPVSVMQR